MTFLEVKVILSSLWGGAYGNRQLPMLQIEKHQKLVLLQPNLVKSDYTLGWN